MKKSVLVLLGLLGLAGCAGLQEDYTPQYAENTVPLQVRTVNMVLHGDAIAEEVLADYSAVTVFLGENAPVFRTSINGMLNPLRSPDQQLDYTQPISLTFIESLPEGVFAHPETKEVITPENAYGIIELLKDGQNMVVGVKERLDELVTHANSASNAWVNVQRVYHQANIVRDFVQGIVSNNSVLQGLIQNVSSAIQPLTQLVGIVDSVAKFLGPIGQAVGGVLNLVNFFMGGGEDPGPSGDAVFILKEMQTMFDSVFKQLDAIESKLSDIDMKLDTLGYDISQARYADILAEIRGKMSAFRTYEILLDSKNSIIPQTVHNKAADFYADMLVLIDQFINASQDMHSALISRLQNYEGTDPELLAMQAEYLDDLVYYFNSPFSIHQYEKTWSGGTYNGSRSVLLQDHNFDGEVRIPNPRKYLPMDPDAFDYLTQMVDYALYLGNYLALENPKVAHAVQANTAQIIRTSAALSDLRQKLGAAFVTMAQDRQAALDTLNAKLGGIKTDLDTMPSQNIRPEVNSYVGYRTGGPHVEVTYKPLEAYSWKGMILYKVSSSSKSSSYNGTGNNVFGRDYYPHNNFTMNGDAPNGTILGDTFSVYGHATVKNPEGQLVLSPTVSLNNEGLQNLIKAYVCEDYNRRVLNAHLGLATLLAAQDFRLKTYLPR